jgi:hypothetical protein
LLVEHIDRPLSSLELLEVLAFASAITRHAGQKGRMRGSFTAFVRMATGALFRGTTMRVLTAFAPRLEANPF